MHNKRLIDRDFNMALGQYTLGQYTLGQCISSEENPSHFLLLLGCIWHFNTTCNNEVAQITMTIITIRITTIITISKFSNQIGYQQP